MKRLLLSGLIGGMLLPVAHAAPQQNLTLAPEGVTLSYSNNGTISSPPVIDAVNIFNYGTFNIDTTSTAISSGDQTLLYFTSALPFETSDTLNFVNAGIMVGTSGWRFDHFSNATGRHSMMSSFVNQNPGVIQAIDPPAAGLFVGNLVVGGGICAVSAVDPGFLIISATNITTGAGTPGSGSSLIVGVNGVLQLTGQKIDLSYSGLEVQSAAAGSVGSPISAPIATNFLPDIGIYDVYWGQTNFSDAYVLRPAPLWDGNIARAQPVPVPPNMPGIPAPGFSLPFPYADSYIDSDFNSVQLNDPSGAPLPPITIRSNIFKGAVFVLAPPGFSIGTAFVGSPQPNNRYLGFLVQVIGGVPNAVSGSAEQEGFIFQDILASDTRQRGYSLNSLYCASPLTFRPQPYAIALLNGPRFNPNVPQYPEPDFLLDSSNTNFVNPPDVLLSDSITNFILNTGAFADYEPRLDNLASRPPSLPGATISNAPGRVLINALESLDLTGTRIRGEGLIRIDTPHLISSTGAVIDVESLSLNVGSKTGNLKVQNLASGSVARLRGNIFAWSATWSNIVTVTFTNYVVNTNNTPPTIDPTNLVVQLGVGYNVLMLDARQLTTTVPENVYDLSLHSRNTVVEDTMNVISSLFIDSQSLTLNGAITIPGTVPPTLPAPIGVLHDWISTNAPNLALFTNNGTLSVVNQAHFGDDRPPYASFVNSGSGTITASGISIASSHFENRGSLSAQAGLFVRCGNGTFDGGSTSAGNIARFSGNALKFNNHNMDAGNGAVFFSASNSLSDAGPGSGNVFTLKNGFHLLVKPPVGDLLGTSFQETAPNVLSARITHTWAGEDRGPTPSGFNNNVALGTLALSSLGPQPLFVFSGTGVHNGLYTDVLDLSGLSTNFLSEIQMSPGLVIYYAAARLPSTFVIPLVGGIAQQPEEYLDGKLAGHLRWVKDYAGPNSSTPVIVLDTNGITQVSIQVNTALRNSKLIDSNGDGNMNGDQDINLGNGAPFSAAVLNVQQLGNGTISPNYAGQLLLVGQQYQLMAQPADGFQFINWSGSTNTAFPQIQFVMTNGLTYIARFSFLLAPGSYNGLFFEDPPRTIELQRSGAITITTAGNGKCSGTVLIGAKRYGFSGQLNTNGAATINIPKSTLTLQLQAGTDHVTGTINDGTNWTASIQADRAVFNAKLNKAPMAGAYTMVFPGSGDTNNSQVPFGDGYASVTVDGSGRVKLSGSLADGTPITQSSVVSSNGLWPFFVPLYKGGGQLLGWLSFEDTGDQDISGLVDWIKQANIKAVFYPGGFTNFESDAVGSAYVPTNKPVTGFSPAAVLMTGGNLSTDIVSRVTISDANKVTETSTNKLKLTLDVKRGLFKGSVPNPATGKGIVLSGAILQQRGMASGYFLGTNQSGVVIMQP